MKSVPMPLNVRSVLLEYELRKSVAVVSVHVPEGNGWVKSMSLVLKPDATGDKHLGQAVRLAATS